MDFYPWELKAFKKVQIKAGGTKDIAFTLLKKDLSFYDPEGNLIFEPGEFEIQIGPNSRDVIIQSVIFDL